ncbi:hypothetical protein GFY24_30265 [Nocardia sp. SYP-A9097]|uniref:TRAFAC clade GTPase domain-containing protein n=1 Tax=Nocardia sp. SYP-A9097 TaxID=2663237 RepID=UPI00129B844A|nr:hypothetical protein [Nocardia sp. SYP-A9097]MRH91675.1 hypothetical protein [Nocardia sp. SYP-A9097]
MILADGGEAVGAVFLGAIAITVTVVVVWVILAAMLHAFSYLVLIYYPLSIAVGILTGIGCAAVVVVGDLLTAGERTARTLTPAHIADDGFFGRPPRGPSRYFGWDRAWPRYLPFQARRDIVDAARAAARFLLGHSRRVLSECDELVPFLLYLVFGLVPHVVFALAFTAFAAFVLMVCTALVLLGWLLQFIAIVLLRVADSVISRVFRLSTRCVKCYEVTRLPSYRCTGCSIVHRDLRPSRLGVLWHRCECSAVLPTMVTRASGWALRKNIVCPACDHGMPEGTGSRQTIQVPTFGAVGAGKTRLLFAAAVGLCEVVSTDSTRIEPLDDYSAAELERAGHVIAARQRTVKTAHGPTPEALAILVAPENRRPFELHLLDAAGEHFSMTDGAESLHYLHSAETLLLVVDPFSTEELRAAIPDPAAVGLVVGDSNPEDSYSITIELLRAAGLKTKRRALGIVVSKVDDLRRLGVDGGLDPGDQDSIVRWLVDRGLDNLVTRARQDFKRVRYFPVDSMGQSITDPCHPIHTLNWLTQQVGVTLIPAPAVRAVFPVKPVPVEGASS